MRRRGAGVAMKVEDTKAMFRCGRVAEEDVTGQGVRSRWGGQEINVVSDTDRSIAEQEESIPFVQQSNSLVVHTRTELQMHSG